MAATDYRSHEAREAHEAVIDAGGHFFQLLGLRDAPVADGVDISMEIDLAPWITNPGGGLQGGLMSALADVAAGRAVLAKAGPGRQCVTVDLTMHYLHAIATGPARANARVIRHGRQLAVVNVELIDAGTGDLAAVSTVTFSIITPKSSPKEQS